MTRSLQRPVSVEGDVFTDAGDHESTKQGNLRLGLNRSIKGKERADEIGEEVMIGKALRPTVTFSPHPRHHPYRSDARVATSLRAITGQRSYIYTPRGPTSGSIHLDNEMENSPTRTPRQEDQHATPLTSSVNFPINVTPKSILKRNRSGPIRVVATVEEGTRGNAEELRQSGRRRPGLQVKDSFVLNKERAVEGPAGGIEGGAFREADVPSSDRLSSDTGKNEEELPERRGGQDGNDTGDNGRSPGNNNDSSDPVDVEMVEVASSPCTIDSLLDIILNEKDDLLAIEDAYNLLFARFKRSFVISAAADKIERTEAQEKEAEKISEALKRNVSDVYRALMRDIKRLVQPASADTRFLGSSSPIPTREDKLATPSPSPQTASSSDRENDDQEDTPKPRRQGYSEAEVRDRRAATGVGQAALKVFSFIGYNKELHGHFSDADISSLLSAVMIIPATPKLNTPNSKRTYVLAIYVISLLVVPISCLVPVKEKIVRALLNATGEICTKFWGGGPGRQEGLGGNIKARVEGYSAIWNVCSKYPSLFLPYHKDFVPEIIKGLTSPSPTVRARASAAAGGFSKGKLRWLRESKQTFKTVVQDGKLVEEDDEEWETRKLEAEKEWRRARDTASESEATTVQQLKRGSKAPYGQENGRRQIVWDEVEKMLKQTMINDPHWSCASWSCLVTMLGDGYINDSQRYKSMQHIILAPLSKQETGPPRSAGRIWLSRFAYDHTIYAIMNYKKKYVVDTAGLPGITYDLDYSLGDKMLGAVMSLVAEAWKREEELIRGGGRAETFECPNNNATATLAWRRKDSEASQTYLKACGSGIVGIAYAYTTAIIRNSYKPESPDCPDQLEIDRSMRNQQLDKLWSAISPVLINMLQVEAVDWLKLEAWKILAQLFHGRPALTDSNTQDDIDQLLHTVYLDGEAANTDIVPHGREQSILELAHSLVDKRILPEDLVTLPCDWVAAHLPRGLGRLFQEALQGVRGFQDSDLVPELNRPTGNVRLPDSLIVIWQGLLLALKSVATDTPIFSPGLLEIVRVATDVYSAEAQAYLPPSLNAEDLINRDTIQLDIFHDLVEVAIDCLGFKALADSRLALDTVSSFRDATTPFIQVISANEAGNPTAIGAWLHKLVTCPPVDLATNASVQRVYLEVFDLLVMTLESGGPAKRTLGDLTNALYTFHNNCPSIRQHLWRTLSRGWIRVMQSIRGTSTASNNTCRILVEMMIRPFRENWIMKVPDFFTRDLLDWVELVRAAVERSEMKGVAPHEAVLGPFAEYMVAWWKSPDSDCDWSSQLTLTDRLLSMFPSADVGLSEAVYQWCSTVLERTVSLDLVDRASPMFDVMDWVVTRVETEDNVTKDRLIELHPIITILCMMKTTKLKSLTALETVCFHFLTAVTSALESGCLIWDQSTVRQWSPVFAALLNSEDLERQQTCRTFLHRSYDKFGVDCFPTDQINNIRSSLGIVEPPPAEFEPLERASSLSPSSSSRTASLDSAPSIPTQPFKEAQNSSVVSESAGYEADVSALTPSIKANVQVKKERGMKRKAEEQDPTSSRRLRSHASVEFNTPSPSQLSRRQRKRLNQSQGSPIVEGSRRGKSRRLKGTKSLPQLDAPHRQDQEEEGDCIRVTTTPPSASQSARLHSPLKRQSSLPLRGHQNSLTPTVRQENRLLIQPEVVVPVLAKPLPYTAGSPKLSGASTEQGGGPTTPATPQRTSDGPSMNKSRLLRSRKVGKVHILLIATGSVASIKVPNMITALCEDDRFEIQVVATESACTYLSPNELPSAVTLWADKDTLDDLKGPQDSFLHVELRKWADIVLVAPCSADDLAKIAVGICDSLATSVLRAFSPATPTFVFPAMDPLSYAHPLTTQHIDIVRNVIGFRVIGPQHGQISTSEGKVDPGAMTNWREVVGIVKGKADDLISATTKAGVEAVSM